MQFALIVTFLLGGIFSSLHSAQAAEVFSFQGVEAAVHIPAVLWSMGQNFNSNVGFDASVYFPRFIDPTLNNYVQVGYDSMPIKADGTSSLKVIPVVFGIEPIGRVSDAFRTSFGLGIGGSMQWLSVLNSQSYKIDFGFVAQIRPGIEYVASENISIVGRMPVYFIVNSNSMSMINFDLGVKIKI